MPVEWQSACRTRQRHVCLQTRLNINRPNLQHNRPINKKKCQKSANQSVDLYLRIGMGTETRYLIGLGAKLWKTGVSISSDVNGSAIGTGEIKKTHIHLLLLYIHIILLILSHQSRLLFLYRFILKHLSMMHFCYSQFRSEIALMRRSFSARNMRAV